MGFAVGETVGPYHITQYIGQGGMATIYRAHQTTLDRDVALKVIHPALKDDESFLIRMNREAAIVARLNHPNIVTVYDFGEHEGVPYLVLRLIEGKTLKATMQEHPLEIGRILTIAGAIASALTYAHSHGVLHRDVKPSNVLLDNEGNVYLTDFGLARLAHSSDNTLSRDMLIGSPQYISPEQAKGEPVDERSDVYSFGVLLYEMFTGHVPFSGDTPYATIMAQINDPLPSPRSLNPKTPRAVEIVLQKALAKDRDERYASIADMMSALENAINGPQAMGDSEPIPIIPHPFEDSAEAAKPSGGNPATSGTPAPTKSSRLSWPLFIAIILGACLLAACIVGVGVWRLAPGIAAQPSPSRPIPALGLVGLASTPTRTALPPRSPAPTSAPTVIPSPVPSSAPVVPSAPVSPTETETIRGRIAYSTATGELPEDHSIWVANADGTEATRLIDVAAWPAFSPNGKQIAYYRMKDTGIYVADSDGSNIKSVLRAADTCCIQWAPDGKSLIFFKGNLRLGGSIYTIKLDGSNLTEITRGYNPVYSPDGKRVALASCKPNSSQCGLFIFDLKTKSETMLTRDNGANPQWSPRGDRILYQADDGKGHLNVFSINPDGTGLKQMTFGKGNDGQPNWSRDGSFIFWRSDQDGAGWAIYAIHSDGTAPRLIIGDAPASANWGRESLTLGP